MSWTLAIGALTPGIWIWSVGVPGGTSTVTVTCAPPTRVTRRVRCSADAGIVAAPNPARRRPAVARPMSSLRLCMRRRDARGAPGGVTLAWVILAERRTFSGRFDGNRGTWVAVGSALVVGRSARPLDFLDARLDRNMRAFAPIRHRPSPS